MQIDKASEKSIRITAMDTEDQGVKVFLISVSTVVIYTTVSPLDRHCLCCSWSNGFADAEMIDVTGWAVWEQYVMK